MSHAPIPSGPPPPRRNVFLAVLLVLVGLVLLLPGICVLVFFSYDPKGMLTDSLGVMLLVVCLGISAGGIAMIWAAVRWPRR